MHYGQEEVSQQDIDTPPGDARGVVPKNVADVVRKIRAAEQWERYDSIVIGPGATKLSVGWFENWNDFANADSLSLFSGRAGNVGPAYTNQRTERTDWAQDIWQMGIEFFSPPGIAEYADNPLDGGFMQTAFLQEVAQRMSCRVVLAESDDIARAPASHFPAGFGVTNTFFASQAAPVTYAGTMGNSDYRNSWKFPEPVMLAAKSKIGVELALDNPVRDLLRAITGPGTWSVPDSSTLTYPLWYVIRVTLRGPRYLQLRGARSSS